MLEQILNRLNHLCRRKDQLNCLILFGFKASGKTTLGKHLAQILKRPFIDTDHLLEMQHQMAVRNLYETLQESAFRKVESDLILSLKKDGSVIALGGGAVLNPINVTYLQTIGDLFYLDTPFEILERRIFEQKIPSFIDFQNPKESLKKIYLARKRIYESIPAERIYAQ